MEGVEEPDGLTGDILVIGFGRFGQIASQPLHRQGPQDFAHRHRHRDDPRRGAVRR